MHQATLELTKARFCLLLDALGTRDVQAVASILRQHFGSRGVGFLECMDTGDMTVSLDWDDEPGELAKRRVSEVARTYALGAVKVNTTWQQNQKGSPQEG